MSFQSYLFLDKIITGALSEYLNKCLTQNPRSLIEMESILIVTSVTGGLDLC